VHRVRWFGQRDPRLPAQICIHNAGMNELDSRLLPANDPLRHELHNEVHARPSARVRLPALITSVAVLNAAVSREQECAHLAQLPGHADLSPERLQGNFLRLRCDGFTVKWERHTEFTRYSIVQPLPGHAHWGASQPELASHVATGTPWLRGIPGATVAAVQLGMLSEGMGQADVLATAQQWLGEGTIVGSQMGKTEQGGSHSCLLTHFLIGADGFERMLVLTQGETPEGRAGRISQRVFELETYRLMALRGLPVAKQLSPDLAKSEAQLASIAARLDTKRGNEQELLDDLVALAARVERATAEHGYRFSATRAYEAVIRERISEMHERPLSGTQTVGEFMQRRTSPAIATVAATAQRLTALSERIARTSALLRTRVDIATEAQNHQLLEKLTRGQELQLRLQSTVEGLSIAAISYYVVSLIYYGSKALSKLGLAVNPEVAAGAAIPVVLWAVWTTVQRIHARIYRSG
jgi:uncharacterized membrane-anchored protein